MFPNIRFTRNIQRYIQANSIMCSQVVWQPSKILVTQRKDKIAINDNDQSIKRQKGT